MTKKIDRTDTRVKTIIELRDQGLSFQKIAAEMRISDSTVRRIYHKHKSNTIRDDKVDEPIDSSNSVAVDQESESSDEMTESSQSSESSESESDEDIFSFDEDLIEREERNIVRTWLEENDMSEQIIAEWGHKTLKKFVFILDAMKKQSSKTEIARLSLVKEFIKNRLRQY